MVDFDANVKLVYYVYEKHFKQFDYIKKDLYQEGFLGLWKACKNFDINRKKSFATFACVCIYNSISMYLSQNELKHINNSLEMDTDHKENLLNNFSGENNIDSLLTTSILNNSLKKYNNRNQKIILDFFKGKKQIEIASELKISQATISFVITDFKNQIKNQLG